MNLTEEIQQFRWLNSNRFAEEISEKRVNEIFDIVMMGKHHEALLPLTYCDSPIEKILFLCLWDLKREWEVKIGAGYLSIVPQYDFELDGNGYRADFFIHDGGCPADVRVIVECDGHEFHEKTKEQAAHDKKRDRLFQKYRYSILRYTGREVYADPFQRAKGIWETIMEIYSGPKLASRG